jgi:hypothetical protein
MSVIDNILRDFVRLYRVCGRPSIADDSFSYSTDSATDNLIQVFNDFCVHSQQDITSVKVSGVLASPPLEVCDAGKTLAFNCHVPSSGFHENIGSFVKKTPSLHKGVMPTMFYISQIDYFHGESEVVDEIDRIARVCRFISFLGKVLTHSEDKANCTQFILLTHDKGNQSARKQLFETRFEYSDIVEPIEIKLLEEITEKEDLHSTERVAVFRNTLAEFLEKEYDPKRRFAFLLKNIKNIINDYRQNYETYINGFALNKFKMEVVSKSDELIQKLNATLNDIVSKVLVVPASLLALKALGGSNDITTDIMVTFSIIAISILITILVWYQFSSINQIEENIKLLFKEFDNREGAAADVARENKKRLLQKKYNIKIYLFIFMFIVWLPSMFCLAYLLKEYSLVVIWNELSSWITIFKSRCCECFRADPNAITKP